MDVTLLQNLPILALLPPAEQRLVVASFEAVRLPFGSVIVAEGSAADAFFVLTKGRARAVKHGPDGAEITLNTLQAGDSFGEIALLERSRRSTTVRASSAVELGRLDATVFHELLAKHPQLKPYFDLQVKHRSLNDFFRLCTPFARLDAEAQQMLLTELEPVEGAAGTLLFDAGDPAGPMYVVEDGLLRSFVEVDGTRQYLSYLRKGDFFGEVSLFQDSPRTASVEAVSTCRLLKLAPATFQKLRTASPAFQEAIAAHIAQYEQRHRTARVPLDFATNQLLAEMPANFASPSVATSFSPVPPASLSGQRWRCWRFPFVRQLDAMDCGAACLTMVSRAYGSPLSLAQARAAVQTTTTGTSLQALCLGAESLGLPAQAVQTSNERLAQLPRPFIAHWHGQHWLVVYEVTQQHVRLADPAYGLKRLDRATFERGWSGHAALIGPPANYTATASAELRELFKSALPNLLKLAVSSLVVALLELALPLLTQRSVTQALAQERFELTHWDGVLLCVLCLGGIARLWQSWLLSAAATEVSFATSVRLVQQLFALPFDYFRTRRLTELQARLVASEQLHNFLLQHGLAGFSAAGQLLLALLLLAYYSPRLALLVSALAALVAALARLGQRRSQPWFEERTAVKVELQTQQHDVLRGIAALKASGAEAEREAVLTKQLALLNPLRRKTDFVKLSTAAISQWSQGFLLAGCLLFGFFEMQRGLRTPGELAALGVLALLLHAPLVALLKLWLRWPSMAQPLDRLSDLLEHAHESVDGTRLPVVTLEGHIRVQQLRLQSSAPSGPWVLDGISFDVPPGMLVAIVGRSGAGKTALLQCLAGLLEPTSGALFFDHVATTQLDWRSLRRQIGCVWRTNALFNDTLARNIALGEAIPDAERVLATARLAHVTAFADQLPLGYETPVDAEARTLTPEQSQRIAWARALYREPPILLLDDAWHDFPPETARLFHDTLSKLRDGRTILMVTRQPELLRMADLILVLEQGRVVERGTHEELRQRRGLYAQLVSSAAVQDGALS